MVIPGFYEFIVVATLVSLVPVAYDWLVVEIKCRLEDRS